MTADPTPGADPRLAEYRPSVEALARALHESGIGCKPNIPHCRATHRGHAIRIFDALPVAPDDEARRLVEAVETEWYNGNVGEGARDRILGRLSVDLALLPARTATTEAEALAADLYGTGTTLIATLRGHPDVRIDSDALMAWETAAQRYRAAALAATEEER